MAIIIQEEILQSTGWTEEQLRLEIAVAMFKEGVFTMAQARKFAKMERLDFFYELGRRKIPLFSVEELEKDIENLKNI